MARLDLLVCCMLCGLHTVLGQSYPFKKNLGTRDNFILRWDYDNTRIRFEVDVATTGWVALGISQNGKMTPADVAIGYVKNDQAFLGDFHTTGYERPTYDTSQDLTLEWGEEVNGRTKLRFSRKLTSSEPGSDIPITTDTTRLIFAFNNADPENWNNFNMHSFRGSQSVQLLSRFRPTQQPDITLSREFLANQFSVPADPTVSSRCYVFDMSNVQTKHHIIKAEAVYSSGEKEYVHQMYLYRCKTKVVPTQAGGYDCNDPAVRYCRSFVANFGYGVDELVIPENIGLPLGGAGESNMYVLANFYDNYDSVAGVVSTSGIRLWYTQTLRRIDGAFMTLGNLVGRNWVQFLPPGEESFQQTATCSSGCLKLGVDTPRTETPMSTLPMSIIGVLFQSNTRGRTMKLRHFVEVPAGTLERPWVASDDSYTSISRELRALRFPVRIIHNESLTLECTYNTQDATSPIYGGWGPENELCRAYVLYYPPKNIDNCLSWNRYDNMLDENNAQVLPKNFYQKVINTDWQSAAGNTIKENLKTTLRTSSVVSQCWSPKRNPQYAFDFKPQTTPLREFVKPRANA